MQFSCRRFCDNCRRTIVMRRLCVRQVGKFLIQRIGDMLAYRLYIASKQLRHLMTIQPHRLVFKTNIEPNGFVRLIYDNLVFVRTHITSIFTHILYQTSLKSLIIAFTIERSFSHPSFPSSEIYLWRKSRRKSTATWLLYRRIHIPSWLFYRPTTITGTNIIISVLISTDVATMNDLRRFVPICGHSISKTRLAG